jgi:sorting nexin-29
VGSKERPKDWEEGIICPIFKKVDILKCANYRGITLLNTYYNIFSNILSEWIKPCAERITGNYECGFRTGKSTSDQIHALTQILEETVEFNTSTFHLFIYFKSAYDSIKKIHSLKQ